MINAEKTIKAIKEKLDGMTDEEKVAYLNSMGFEFRTKTANKSDTKVDSLICKPLRYRRTYKWQMAPKATRARASHKTPILRNKVIAKKKG